MSLRCDSMSASANYQTAPSSAVARIPTSHQEGKALVEFERARDSSIEIWICGVSARVCSRRSGFVYGQVWRSGCATEGIDSRLD